MPASRKAPLLLLGVALAASAVVLLSLSSGLTFFQDTWAYLMHRQGFSAQTFLEPHNEHIVVVPVALEKLLIAVFGMTSALPEYIALNVLLAVTGALLFVYVRRRVGDWPALLATVLVLFLGPAWQVLLWPFEIALVGSTAAGIAALLAIEREDRRGDIAAAVLVTVAVGFSSLGLPFAFGVFVDVVQRHRGLGWRRLYVPFVGVGLYLLWYVGYGHEAESAFSLANVRHSPVFVLEGLSASVGALSGLTTLSGDPAGRPYLGFAAMVVGLLAIAWVTRRFPGFLSRFWPPAATAAAFWVLAAFNRDAGREAESNRYMHVGAILILIMAADLLDGVRFRLRAVAIGAAVVLAAVAINYSELQDGSDWLHEQTLLTKADTGAMQIAERTIDPGFALAPDIAGTPTLIDVNAAEYFEAERDHGSPAYTPAELARADEQGRRQADIVLAAALPVSTEVERDASLAGAGDCVEIGGRLPRNVASPLPRGETRIGVPPGPEAKLWLRRYDTEVFPVELDSAPGESVTTLIIPRDRSRRPWQLYVEAERPVRVCRG